MKFTSSTLPTIGIFAGILSLVLSTTAAAHVTVKPAEVITAGFQTFTVSVPNEKDIATTSVKLRVPEGVTHVQPTQKAGWQIVIATEGSGEAAAVTSLTWNGGEIKAGFRDEFTFSGQVPEKSTELQWKAYQTYADGTVVNWDKAGGHDADAQAANSGPFSVTKVVTKTPEAVSLQRIEQVAAEAGRSANTARYIGIAGIVVGLIGVYIGTRTGR